MRESLHSIIRKLGQKEDIMKVIKLEQTTTACPTQFEGQLENGHYIYIRYRGGFLLAGSAKSEIDFWGNKNFVLRYNIFNKSIGDQFDGWIKLDEIAQHITTLDFSEVL